MSSVGALILAIGAAKVGGAIWYRTHVEATAERTRRWRERLEGWE